MKVYATLYYDCGSYNIDKLFLNKENALKYYNEQIALEKLRYEEQFPNKLYEERGYSHLCFEEEEFEIEDSLNSVSLIQELKKVKGAISYDGDCSTQVLLPTTDNKYLRVGVTDDDVAEKPGIWFDYYEGLNNELNNKNYEKK
jgi:hypothetical protein